MVTQMVKDLLLETLRLYMKMLLSLTLALITVGVIGRYWWLFKSGITLKIQLVLDSGS